MNIETKIQSLYQSAKNYPELVKGLIEIGILSYTVDVTSSTILYRLSEGIHLIHPGKELRTITPTFNEKEAIQAVKNTQAGNTTYPEFMNEIALAGVRFYEATLNGKNMRVTYIGSGGIYEEAIPVSFS